MGLMYHGIQCQHDAGDLVYQFPRGNTIKQASPEHIINSPMALLVDGVTLGMVWGGQQPLDPQGAGETGPNLANEFPTTV